MLESRDLFQDGEPIGWYVYRASDQGGTLYVAALRGREDVVDRFVQSWYDHRPMIRALVVARVDRLEAWDYPSEGGRADFHVVFNEIVEPGDGHRPPEIIGWYGLDGRTMRFTGLERYRRVLKGMVEEIGLRHGVREGLVGWADEITVEHFYEDEATG